MYDEIHPHRKRPLRLSRRAGTKSAVGELNRRWEMAICLEVMKSQPTSAEALGPRARLTAHPARAAVGPLLAIGLALFAAPGARAQDLTEARRIEIARRLQESSVVVAVGGSTGSGFVTGPERFVVTNAHVVENARFGAPVGVRFSDGLQRPARILAVDLSADLAVLDVPGAPAVPPLELGNSDEVVVGQTVLAFGSPFGLEGTLTQGIVSARRDLPAIGGAVRGLIQTDATINPGNSGGPLVSSRGEVVGVNTAILSRSGGSQGIGFAVPASYVRALLDRIRAGRRAPPLGGASPAATGQGPSAGGVAPSGGPGMPSGSTAGPSAALVPMPPRAPDAAHAEAGGGGEPLPEIRTPVWLGIYGDDFRHGGYAGVRVQQVVRGSPAEAAGLAGALDRPPPYVRQLGLPWTGHIILALDGQPVRSMDELTALLATRRPGQRATVLVTVGPGVLSGETVVELRPPPRAPAPRQATPRAPATGRDARARPAP
jgi:S1-C subfamily serine protease